MFLFCHYNSHLATLQFRRAILECPKCYKVQTPENINGRYIGLLFVSSSSLKSFLVCLWVRWTVISHWWAHSFYKEDDACLKFCSVLALTVYCCIAPEETKLYSLRGNVNSQEQPAFSPVHIAFVLVCCYQVLAGYVAAATWFFAIASWGCVSIRWVRWVDGCLMVCNSVSKWVVNVLYLLWEQRKRTCGLCLTNITEGTLEGFVFVILEWVHNPVSWFISYWRITFRRGGEKNR